MMVFWCQPQNEKLRMVGGLHGLLDAGDYQMMVFWCQPQNEKLRMVGGLHGLLMQPGLNHGVRGQSAIFPEKFQRDLTY